MLAGMGEGTLGEEGGGGRFPTNFDLYVCQN